MGPLVADPAGCSHEGCRIPASLASYTTSDGRRWCISHNPDQRPKQDATTKGGAARARKDRKVMPEGSPAPDWSTPKAIRAWAEDRAGRVERGELDKRLVPQELAQLAKATHDSELLAKLDDLELLIRARTGVA